MYFSAKYAIVTGASRGIGAAVSIKYAQNGINLILCSRTSCESTLNEVRKYGVEAYEFLCDVSYYNDVKLMIDYALTKFKRIDILANIAGISPKKEDGMKIRFYEQEVDQWDRVLDINLNSMFYTSRLVAPVMINNHFGRIINMSSIVGMTNSEHGPASAAYVTSKTGVIGLTRAMAYDLAEYGITVNAIAAGRIETAMSASNNDYYNELHEKLIPMHRFGTVDEVSDLFLFFASDNSSYITGETTNITGGWYI